MNNQLQSYQEDEIDIKALWNTLLKSKKLIIIFTLSLTFLAILYILIKTPTYGVKSNVMVGYIGQDKDSKKINIANPDVIAKTLNVVFNVEDKVKVENFVSEVSSVSINKKLKNFITVKTEAISNEEALKKNKEVVEYLQSLYQSKIDRYLVNTDNNIKATKVQIENLENLETKNLQRQIELLKTQNIVKIDEKINFHQNIKLKTLNEKISFQAEKLKEYTKEVKEIYKNSKNNSDTATLAISSIQMVNYQNLILNSQNKIEDLKIEIEILKNQTIPNLQRDKKNISNVNIKDLQLKIDNINNVTIVNLQRDKKNMQNDTLRKLEYKLTVDLPNKKAKLNQQIEQLKYNKSEQNIQNSKIIGEFVIKDYPIKPKKILIVVVAFITGLILSIFLVFFLNFIRNED